MKIAPLQSFGLGDIIFCQSLANQWLEEGHEVVWGAEPQFVEGLQRAYPAVRFVDWQTLPIDYNSKLEHDSNGYRVVPLRWSVEITGVEYKDCMRSKYSLFNQPVENWRNGAAWIRDGLKELQLKKSLILPDKYALVNTTYQSDGKGQKPIHVQSFLPIVELRATEGYSMFDWYQVIENATEIHTVSTSLFYMLEMMNLKQPIHLYSRPNDPTFSHINYLFTKDYILHK